MIDLLTTGSLRLVCALFVLLETAPRSRMVDLFPRALCK